LSGYNGYVLYKYARQRTDTGEVSCDRKLIVIASLSWQNGIRKGKVNKSNWTGVYTRKDLITRCKRAEIVILLRTHWAKCLWQPETAI
jgi:hypothetical protein